MYLKPELQHFFSDSTPLFDQLMSMQGKSYRALEGRTTQQVELGNQTYFLKSHQGVGWKEIIKNLLQGRWPVISAKNEWQALQQLKLAGIGVPEVLGYGQQGMNPAKCKSFVLMSDITPSISLETLCEGWKIKAPNAKEKRELIKQVAVIAKTMHEQGINHRDFYLCHFLMNNAGQLHLIDLHRAQCRKKVPKRWLMKDLSGLYFSSMGVPLTKRDQWRFAAWYRGRSIRDIIQHESQFWRKVTIRGKRLYDRHR